MAQTRFTSADTPGVSALSFGPGLPSESDLRLLGPVEGRRVLDLGCGDGAGTVALATAGARVIALDEDDDNVRTTREAAERAGVRVETHHGPLPELAFVRADTIDAAVSVYGLQAAGDLDRVFRQVHRVLKADRPLVFSLPHPAFAMLDPDAAEPVVRRAWWDASGARTLGGVFAGLTRANFRVDALAEPQPDRATCPEEDWSNIMRWVPPTLVVRARKVA
ncbi:MAG TPA: class I SAM-dependent methyltransferase [Acidimicrobiales bacterium]|nr:class I SAM-dependent methyltransferase [Acidimicrobiales bacterium]